MSVWTVSPTWSDWPFLAGLNVDVPAVSTLTWPTELALMTSLATAWAFLPGFVVVVVVGLALRGVAGAAKAAIGAAITSVAPRSDTGRETDGTTTGKFHPGIL
jgi:uncharacterized membrane protein